MQITLNNLQVGETACVAEVNTEKALKQRLCDIGFLKNSEVKVVHSSPSGNPRAYLIRGSVIALRNCDAEKITVTKEGLCGET